MIPDWNKSLNETVFYESILSSNVISFLYEGDMRTTCPCELAKVNFNYERIASCAGCPPPTAEPKYTICVSLPILGQQYRPVYRDGMPVTQGRLSGYWLRGTPWIVGRQLRGEVQVILDIVTVDWLPNTHVTIENDSFPNIFWNENLVFHVVFN